MYGGRGDVKAGHTQILGIYALPPRQREINTGGFIIIIHVRGTTDFSYRVIKITNSKPETLLTFRF